jgi:hypothetical protein
MNTQVCTLCGMTFKMSTIFSGIGFPIIFLRKRHIHPISELQAAVGRELRILKGVMQYEIILITGERGQEKL